MTASRVQDRRAGGSQQCDKTRSSSNCSARSSRDNRELACCPERPVRSQTRRCRVGVGSQQMPADQTQWLPQTTSCSMHQHTCSRTDRTRNIGSQFINNNAPQSCLCACAQAGQCSRTYSATSMTSPSELDRHTHGHPDLSQSSWALSKSGAAAL